jgi:ABC-type Na+ efflux pump permease subunit
MKKMKDILTVMKFTIKDMVKRKSFIISTLIILALIVVGFNIPNIIKSMSGDNTGDKLLIVDNENIFEGNLELLKQMDLGYEIEIGPATFEEIKEKIEDGGFILAHWDGTPETEEKIKEETKATIRCIPLDGDKTPGKCMVTGKPSAQRVVFARSY